MALPTPPDIPRIKSNDKDYMGLWHKYMQARKDNYELERERNTWRAVSTFLFALVLTLTVLALGTLIPLA